MAQLPLPLSHDLDLEATALAHEAMRLERSWVARGRRLGAGIEAQWARLPGPLRAQVEAQMGQALQVGLGLAARAPLPGGRRGARWVLALSGAAGGAGGMVGALAEMPLAVVLFLQVIREEARAAGLDPDREGVRRAMVDILISARPLAVEEVLDAGYFSGRLALAGPTLSGWIARVAPRLVPVLGRRMAAAAVPVVGALGGAVMNAAWAEHYRALARIRFRLMVLAEHHGAEAVVRAFGLAERMPLVK